MKSGRLIRTIVTLLTLLMYGTAEVWAAVSTEDIFIQIMPSGIEGKGPGPVEANEGSVSVSVGALTGEEGSKYYPVTLTVTPADGYRTKTDLIVAEKMIDPSVLPSRRRAPRTGTFDVTGPNGWSNGPTSYTYTFNIDEEFHGAYVTVTFVETPPANSDLTQISTFSELQAINSNSSGSYILVSDIDASGLTSSLSGFSGTLDGNFHKIYNLGVPLFSSVSGTVKNITFEDVSINVASGDAGAITALATGAARIYNCGILPSSTDYDNEGNITGFSGSSVSGSGNVGGLVGTLSGTARVINCYSYANITGGTTVGGIVGNNTVATTSANLATMVMNCMFYGDITSGNKAPIYNGTIITNDGDANGVNNFNYFWSGASYVKNRTIDVYNCALSAETRFLQRFEFFRHLLNSNRELAAWWVTGRANDKEQMMKWVLEPNQIGSNIPFPILKTPGKYYSIVNYDADHAETIDANNEHRNEGRKLTNMGTNGTLAVTIQMGSQGTAPFGKPEGAGIKSGKTFPINIPITDKDTLHYNFNYGKVQLPYYNDYCDGNYTGDRVVTGWKIVSITGGEAGSYYTADAGSPADVTYDESGNLTATPYNFADRSTYAKDLYSSNNENGASGRIFNQGAYWDVPDKVTAITIEPYWGKAVYLADAYYDVVYQNGTRTDKPNDAGYIDDAMTTPVDVATVGGGQHYADGVSKFNNQLVLFQILKDDAVKVLHSICQQIWKTQQWPQDWKRSVFIPIPKKGNAKECSNYRTIALISFFSKSNKS